MDINDYTRLRESLISGHNDLQKKLYAVMCQPQIFMSVKELENRPVVRGNHSMLIDDDFHEFRRHRLNLGQIIPLVDNLTASSGFYFDDSADIVFIFERIQRYLTDWMTVANRLPEYFIPPLDELYKLEEFALWLFNVYKPVILTAQQVNRIRNKERVQLSDENPFLVLLDIGFGEKEQDGKTMKFSSIIDAHLPRRLRDHYERTTKAAQASNWEFEFAELEKLL